MIDHIWCDFNGKSANVFQDFEGDKRNVHLEELGVWSEERSLLLGEGCRGAAKHCVL